MVLDMFNGQETLQIHYDFLQFYLHLNPFPEPELSVHICHSLHRVVTGQQKDLISKHEFCCNISPKRLPNVLLPSSGSSRAVLGGPWGECQRGVWTHVSDAAAGHRALPDCVDWVQLVALGQSSCQQHHQPCAQKEVVFSLLGTAHSFACTNTLSTLGTCINLHIMHTIRPKDCTCGMQSDALVPVVLDNACCIYNLSCSTVIFILSPPGRGRAEGWKNLKKRMTAWTQNSRCPGSFKKARDYKEMRRGGYSHSSL